MLHIKIKYNNISSLILKLEYYLIFNNLTINFSISIKKKPGRANNMINVHHSMGMAVVRNMISKGSKYMTIRRDVNMDVIPSITHLLEKGLKLNAESYIDLAVIK